MGALLQLFRRTNRQLSAAPVAAPTQGDAFQSLFGTEPELDRVSAPAKIPAAAPPERELLLQVTFGKGGNDTGYLGIGWSGDETGHRWTIGTISEIWLEHPGPGHLFRIELELYPFVRPPALPAQRLVVRLRGVVIARATVTARRPIALAIPAILLAAPGPVRLVLEHEDAAPPSKFAGHDHRNIAFSFQKLSLYRINAETAGDDVEGGRGSSLAELEQATGLAAADFITRFESLGDNCEFGLVQRRCGAAPIGLLRFSFIALPKLLLALRTRFTTLGAIENLEFFLSPGGEYNIRDKALGLVYHTWKKPGEIEEADILPHQVQRLAFLARKLIEDLTEATKIFVWRQRTGATEADARALHDALNVYGPNTLLWVAPVDEANVVGSVTQLAPRLFRGTIDRLAPNNNAHDLTFDLWLDLCVKIHLQRQQEGASL